jgi:hypothetical protein
LGFRGAKSSGFVLSSGTWQRRNAGRISQGFRVRKPQITVLSRWQLRSGLANS